MIQYVDDLVIINITQIKLFLQVNAVLLGPIVVLFLVVGFYFRCIKGGKV